MIKRILPFVLAFAVLLSFMVSPVRVKADNGYTINLMDFSMFQPQNRNSFGFTNSGSTYLDLTDTLQYLKLYEFEVILSYSGAVPTSYTVFRENNVTFATTVTDLGGGLVKLTGNFNGYFISQPGVKFTSNGDTYVTFLSFTASPILTNRVNLGTTLSVMEGSSSVMSPGGSVSVSSPTGISGCVFYFSLPYSVWSSYDYIDFSGFISNAEISTINASVVSDAYIPISTSVIEDMNSRSFYYWSSRLDLTQGSLGSSGTLTVYITAQVISGSGRLGLDGLSGVIVGEPFDTQNTWYQILLRYMRSGFSSVTNSLQGVEDVILDHLDVVDQWFNEVNTNIDTEFTSLKTKLQTEFTSLKTALSTHFTNITNNLRTWFTNMQTLLTTKFDSVISKLQELIDGQPVDEGVTDDMQQAEDELGNMTDQMENLSPTINPGDVNVDVDDLVSPEGVTSVTSVFSIFTGNVFISTMLTIVIGMATAGYVFFGKR